MRLITVAVGTPVTFTSSGSNALRPDALEIPMTISAIPGAGGTLLVEYQLVESGSWTDWPGGAVVVKTVYLLTGPVYALRFTAATQDGTVEIAE